MTLITSSRSTKLRNHFVLLFLVSCIIYFIYSISNNVQTVNSLESTSLPVVVDEPAEQHVFVTEEVKNVCKTNQVLRNVDPNHTNAHLNFWVHLTDKTIQAYKRRWQKFVSGMKRARIPTQKMKGQGIVIVAGNRDTFHRAITSITLLRKYNCTLNIEVWHLNDEQPTDEVRKKLELLNAFPRDLSDPELVRPMPGRRDAEKQFQVKAAAVINSAFKEVLYLDSDNIPASDPTFLFDIPGYKETGALFWPDFWKTHGENRIFDILGIPCQDEWEQESGQMVIDKEKSWLPLQLAWFMQKHHEVYFQFLNGDKDTFKYAWQALDAPYHMTETFVGMGGVMAANGRFCGHTMLQYTPQDEEEGRLLFVHANLLKITDKIHFIHDNNPDEHPWDLAKRSSMSHSNTYIKPEFWISPAGQACMDFTHREGEPEAITENFDHILPHFQQDYFNSGGIGGETRS